VQVDPIKPVLKAPGAKCSELKRDESLFDPIKPTLEAPATDRLKLKRDDSLLSYAFKFNMRRYTMVKRNQHRNAENLSTDYFRMIEAVEFTRQMDDGRGLHSSTFQLNLSRF
jgi:hypothetical protein